MKRILCIALMVFFSLTSVFAEELVVPPEVDAPAMAFSVADATITPAPTQLPESDTVLVPIIAPITSAQVIETPQPTDTPRLAGIIVGIDPGHQEHANSDREQIAPGSKERKAKVSSGTSGKRTGIPEYVTDLEISLKLRDALEKEGCTVYMTRETNDVDISNQERAIMMNELGAQLVLRLHCDGSTDSKAKGTGMFIRKTGACKEESERAAGYLLDEMCARTGAYRRGIFKRDTYTGLNWSEVPCILVEMGFMSNPEEDEKLNDPEYQQLLVEGMVEGICRYFER